MTRFGKSLKSAIIQAGISQNELAKRAGVSQGAVSRYIKGEITPTEETLKALADALDVSIEDLVGRSSDPDPVMCSRITLLDAAQCMHKSVQFVRYGLITGSLPFGVALQVTGSKRYSYYIQPEKFRDFVGAAAFDSHFREG